MSNRRDFFKSLAAFVGGVAAAKASTYIPKKEEPKEVVMVSSAMTLVYDGKEYHPLVVMKTEKDGMEYEQPKDNNNLSIHPYGKAKIRKANV